MVQVALYLTGGWDKYERRSPFKQFRAMISQHLVRLGLPAMFVGKDKANKEVWVMTHRALDAIKRQDGWIRDKPKPTSKDEMFDIKDHANILGLERKDAELKVLKNANNTRQDYGVNTLSTLQYRSARK